jgi:N-acetylglucosaminyldiphosphoundecaprenol N-acetyl-beta-D-mannosaminyltransferase
MSNNLSSIKILDVNITTSSKKEILEYIFKSLDNSSQKQYIVTPNPEILIYAKNHPKFKAILNNATVSLPDGIGVLMADRISKKKIIGRITGVDFMDEMCCEASKRPVIVGFLGGRGNVAEKTAERLLKKYPTLKVGFAGEEWNEEGFKIYDLRLKNSISSSSTAGAMQDISPRTPLQVSQLPTTNYKLQTNHIDILFVAFGFPKQEEWIYENLPKINVRLAMGVGGSFDYVSGKVSRAPKFMRNIGMEWVYRLAKEPWRVKRQLALPKFALEVLKERLKTRRQRSRLRGGTDV